MDLFSDLIEAVQSDLTIGDESSLLPLTTVKLAINRAYRKVGGLYRWPETEDAQKTSSEANNDYYDYPENWRPDSIWKLVLDGVDQGDPVSFKDYLYEKENNSPSGFTKMWTSQWRRYFIDPAPTTTGVNNIEVWGQKIVEELSSNGDITIFSYSMPECNEAIVLEADAILRNKGEAMQTSRRALAVSELLSPEARQIVATAWNKVKQDQSKYQKTTPFFNVPDFFSGRNEIRNRIGNF